MTAADRSGVGYDQLPLLAEAGFDYAELPLAQLSQCGESELEEICGVLEECGVPCEACNNFFPASVRLTGPNADLSRALDYARSALDLAAGLGAKTVVFGSSGAKNIPEGWPAEKAFGQLVTLLEALGPMLDARNLTVAIEPICQREGNLILNLTEGLRLMEAVSHPRVRLLADWYHMAVEEESPEILRTAAPVLCHVHLSVPEGRLWPTEARPGAEPMLRALLSLGYGGRVSVEAYSNDFASDAPAAAVWFRSELSRYVPECQ